MCVALDNIVNRGIERGVEKNKYETAINFLKMGLPLEQIAQGVKLPLEKIRQIQLEQDSK